MSKINELKPILFAAMGTLKRGGSNSHLLSSSHFLSVGSTEPVYGMKSLGGFPSLIVGDMSVRVDVFTITPETLHRLDGLEGYREDSPQHSFFTREIIKVTLESGEEVEAWIYYVANPDTIANSPDYTITDEYGRLSWDQRRGYRE
jgi:gamma-glutamylcyclotransferase (GGCT)/AIG2-like uncharacterized protein YtfP